jgi:hypothetical protein
MHGREIAIAIEDVEITATYPISQESISVNMGEPMRDDKGSGSSEVTTPHESSDARTGSQRGHSTRRVGKPRTGGRAAACRCFNADYPNANTEASLWMSAKCRRS